MGLSFHLYSSAFILNFLSLIKVPLDVTCKSSDLQLFIRDFYLFLFAKQIWHQEKFLGGKYKTKDLHSELSFTHKEEFTLRAFICSYFLKKKKELNLLCKTNRKEYKFPPVGNRILLSKINDVNSSIFLVSRHAIRELFIVQQDIDAVIVFRKIVYATWTDPIVRLYGVTLEETTG